MICVDCICLDVGLNDMIYQTKGLAQFTILT